MNRSRDSTTVWRDVGMRIGDSERLYLGRFGWMAINYRELSAIAVDEATPKSRQRQRHGGYRQIVPPRLADGQRCGMST